MPFDKITATTMLFCRTVIAEQSLPLPSSEVFVSFPYDRRCGHASCRTCHFLPLFFLSNQYIAVAFAASSEVFIAATAVMRALCRVTDATTIFFAGRHRFAFDLSLWSLPPR
jgi:hypothetical protein